MGPDHMHGGIVRAGHQRLTDGSVLRVDIERGRWVGRLYTPELELKTQVVGSDAQVHAWVDSIAAQQSRVSLPAVRRDHDEPGRSVVTKPESPRIPDGADWPGLAPPFAT